MAGGQNNALPLGTVVHQRYRILAVVGQGGLGTVYQVADVLYGTRNVFALKELIDQSSGARKQFENESQWLQSLDHNHIPKVREHFEWERRLYLVMDFVDGENLEQKLARLGGRGLPERQVLSWIFPICDALHYMHTRIPPILHRDVKPANIIVTPAGHPVLVDLGIAKEHLPGANQTATFVRKAGTEGYAPPEQYASAGQTGPWSDVYGMGATLYQLLTGGVPPTAVERVALDRRLIHPRDVNPVITVATDAAVCQALALRPAERYQSMQELKRALGGPVATSTLPPQTMPTPTPIRSHPTSPTGQHPAITLGPPPAPATPIRPPTPPSPMTPSPMTPSPMTPSPMTPSPMTPPYASPRSGALPRELPRELLTGTAISTRPRLDSQHSLAVPSGEELLAAARAAALRATTDSPKKRGPRRLRIPRLLMAVTALCVLVAAVIAGMVALRAATPPDRSTAQATISGYFEALKAQDYNRAWQFVAQSRSSDTAQASFVSGLTSDDARYGRVLTYSIMPIEAGNSGQASAQVAVTRAQAPAQTITYAVELTQYGDNTWLINSVTNA